MANNWGTALRLSIFGESHGPAIGIVIDGLPAGRPIAMDKVREQMERRAPGRDAFSTPRREADRVEIQSGLHEGKTTGFPLCGIIHNGDTRSKDYNSLLRPGHADLTALLKYGGHADMRGGGHFSGRITAPLLFAGSVARQLLEEKGVAIYGRIAAIAGIEDRREAADPESYRRTLGSRFPVLDDEAGTAMQEAILEASAEEDSVGGIVEAVAFGVPTGLGSPFFRPMESEIASLLYAVPAVKGVEFGKGFAIAAMRGSQANDPIVATGSGFATTTNNNGGILGGITSGMPLVVRAAIKPTPSIGREQDTVDGATGQPAKLIVNGRHDPCIVPRAVPVVEGVLALAILNQLLEQEGSCG